MAKISRNSLLFGMSGRFGDSIIVHTKRGAHTRNTSSKRTKRAPSQMEAEQMQKFKFAGRFVQNAQSIFKLGYGSGWYSKGIKYVLQSLSNEDGTFVIEFDRLRLSEPKFTAPLEADVRMVDNNMVFSWKGIGGSAYKDSSVVTAIYYPIADIWDWMISDISEGKAQLEILNRAEDAVVECFYFVYSAKGSKASYTFYLGSR